MKLLDELTFYLNLFCDRRKAHRNLRDRKKDNKNLKKHSKTYMERQELATEAIVSSSQMVQEPFKCASSYFEPISGGFGLEIPPSLLRRPRSNTTNDPVSNEGISHFF